MLNGTSTHSSILSHPYSAELCMRGLVRAAAWLRAVPSVCGLGVRTKQDVTLDGQAFVRSQTFTGASSAPSTVLSAQDMGE